MPIHSTRRSFFALALAAASVTSCVAQKAEGSLLRPDDFRHYVTTFEEQERAVTGTIYNGEPAASGQAAETAWPWMQREIPWFESADKQAEEMYYFRWYAWKKHLVHASSGYIITEWLPKPEMKDGNFGALPDAMPFHLGEARWLHTRAIAEDDARFWFSPQDPGIRKYSGAYVTAVRDVTLANGDTSLALSLLPQFERVYREWQSTQQDSNGLFWSIDTRDAMEKSISGDGYRPTLNSYMVADARAIAATARLAQQPDVAREYSARADALHTLIETKLWSTKDHFYEVMSPSADSGIRQQKKFVDPGTQMQLAGVREQIGFNPWHYSSPAPEHGDAWRQLSDPQGFGGGRFGPTTAERRSPRFRFPSSDQCTWNGPAWPFADTQTLLALSDYLDTPGAHSVGYAEYRALLKQYVLAQHIKAPNGEIVDWIDEDYDADTDEWIAKRMLAEKHKQVGRGNYYNHSGFADPLITGLIGLKPREDDRVVVHPAFEAALPWIAIDALPYHGHTLTIAWDASGQHFHRGKGLWIAIDGRVAARRADVGPIETVLPQAHT